MSNQLCTALLACARCCESAVWRCAETGCGAPNNGYLSFRSVKNSEVRLKLQNRSVRSDISSRVSLEHLLRSFLETGKGAVFEASADVLEVTWEDLSKMGCKGKDVSLPEQCWRTTSLWWSVSRNRKLSCKTVSPLFSLLLQEVLLQPSAKCSRYPLETS